MIEGISAKLEEVGIQLSVVTEITVTLNPQRFGPSARERILQRIRGYCSNASFSQRLFPSHMSGMIILDVSTFKEEEVEKIGREISEILVREGEQNGK